MPVVLRDDEGIVAQVSKVDRVFPLDGKVRRTDYTPDVATFAFVEGLMYALRNCPMKRLFRLPLNYGSSIEDDSVIKI